jgi:hypothetical protein
MTGQKQPSDTTESCDIRVSGHPSSDAHKDVEIRSNSLVELNNSSRRLTGPVQMGSCQDLDAGA